MHTAIEPVNLHMERSTSFRARGFILWAYPAIVSIWASASVVVTRAVWFPILVYIISFGGMLLIARRKTMTVSAEGVSLGSTLYRLDQIDRVETYQSAFGGQGRCHLVVRLTDGTTVPWRWISYMRSPFGVLMKEDNISLTNQMYLKALGSALEAHQVESFFIGVDKK